MINIILVGILLIYSLLFYILIRPQKPAYWPYLLVTIAFLHYFPILNYVGRIIGFELIFWIYLLVIRRTPPEKSVLFLLTAPILIFTALFFSINLYENRDISYLVIVISILLIFRFVVFFKDIANQNFLEYWGINLFVFYAISSTVFAGAIATTVWYIFLILLCLYYYRDNNLAYLIQISFIPLLFIILRNFHLEFNLCFYILPLLYQLIFLLVDNKKIGPIGSGLLLIFLLPDLHVLKIFAKIWSLSINNIVIPIVWMLFLWLISKLVIWNKNAKHIDFANWDLSRLPLLIMGIIYLFSGVWP